jgi:hypothetical protein
VLRYGQFYGPGTYNEQQPPKEPRVHIDRAAERTVEALGEPTGVEASLRFRLPGHGSACPEITSRQTTCSIGPLAFPGCRQMARTRHCLLALSPRSRPRLH